MLKQLITDNIDLWTSAETSRSNAGRGSNGKTELTGIKKLRELILELAVRGLLVPQDPNDEPASVLLEKIATEKEALIKAGKIKKQKPLPYIADDEMTFDLPDKWEWSRIGNLVYLEMGQSPPSQFYNQVNDGMPFFQGKADFGELYPTARYWCVKPQKISYPGDVLLSVRAPVGPTNITNTECCIGRGLAALRPLAGMPTGYLLTLMRRNHRKLEALGTGTTFVAVSKTVIDEFCIPVAPLAEQDRIVAKVDELMALCDQLEQQQIQHGDTHHTLVSTLLDSLCQATDPARFQAVWSQLAANFDTLFTSEASIDHLKQTILQLAVMGKLVPQDSNDEPASVLLEKIAAEKEALIKAGKIKKQKPLPEITDDEKPFELPLSWEWIRVWDVAQIITSGSRGWAEYYSNEGAIFVTMGNLSRGHYNLRLENIRYVNPPKTGEGARTKLDANDLLISITGDVGNLGLVPEGFGDAYINQHTCLLRFMPNCQNRYFPELMRSPLAMIQFNAPQRGVKNSFRLGDVGEMIIPIPPLPEQHRIVAKVDELMALCDQLKAHLNQAQTTQQHLAHAIVEQAVA